MAQPTILIAFDGLGAMDAPAPGLEVAGPLAHGYDPSVVREVDHAVEDRAEVVAQEGARLGRSCGRRRTRSPTSPRSALRRRW
jgi:hypothetical protein